MHITSAENYLLVPVYKMRHIILSLVRNILLNTILLKSIAVHSMSLSIINLHHSHQHNCSSLIFYNSADGEHDSVHTSVGYSQCNVNAQCIPGASAGFCRGGFQLE